MTYAALSRLVVDVKDDAPTIRQTPNTLRGRDSGARGPGCGGFAPPLVGAKAIRWIANRTVARSRCRRTWPPLCRPSRSQATLTHEVAVGATPARGRGTRDSISYAAAKFGAPQPSYWHPLDG